MRLLYLGLTDRQVALVFWGMTLVSLLLVVIIERFLVSWTHLYTTLFSVYLIVMFGVFFTQRVRWSETSVNANVPSQSLSSR